MQSFVFFEINKASRDKDLPKIEYYGPFASALGYIVHATQQKKKSNREENKLEETFTVYRGTKLNKFEIEDHFPSDRPCHLLGFTSSTLDKNKACGFAFDAKTLNVDDPEKMPVLVEIQFTGRQQYFYMDSREVSAYPSEKEILLQDGIRYQVVDITPRTETFTVLEKEYTKEVTFVRLKNLTDEYARTCGLFRLAKLLLN